MAAVVAKSNGSHNTSKKRKHEPSPSAPAIRVEEKKRAWADWPQSIVQFLKRIVPLESSLTINAPSGHLIHDVLAFIKQQPTEIACDTISPDVCNLDMLCKLFLENFIYSERGILLFYENNTCEYIEELAHFPRFIAALRAKEAPSPIKCLLVCPVKKPSTMTLQQVFDHVQTILAPMIQRTVESTVETNLYFLFCQTKLWTWWGSLYPVELVFILSKLWFSESPDQLGELLQFCYTNNSHPPHTKTISVQFYLDDDFTQWNILFSVQHLQKQFKTMNVQFQNDTIASQDGLYDTILLRQYIPNGHLEIRWLEPFALSTALKQPPMTVDIPLEMAIFFIYHKNVPLMSQWHNILRAFLVLCSGKKSIESQTSHLQTIGKEWYQQISSRQDIFFRVMHLTAGQLGALFDPSYKVAMNLASYFVSSTDWIAQFWSVISKTSHSKSASPWTWPLYEESMTIKQYFNALLTPNLLQKMWIHSLHRLSMSNVSVDLDRAAPHWMLVIQPELDELRLLYSPTKWWTSSNPLNCTIEYHNGTQLRNTELSSTEKTFYFPTQINIVNSSQYESQFNQWKQPRSFHLVLTSTAPARPALPPCSWLVPVLEALFGSTHPLQMGKNISSLFGSRPELGSQVIRFIAGEEEFSPLFLQNPETLPTALVQSLLYSIRTALLREPAPVYSSGHPHVPGNSIALDTWSFLVHYNNNHSFSDQFQLNPENGAIKRDTLLLILKTGGWLIVELNRYAKITFTSKVLYRSPALMQEVAISTILSHTELTHYLARACFIFETVADKK